MRDGRKAEIFTSTAKNNCRTNFDSPQVLADLGNHTIWKEAKN